MALRKGTKRYRNKINGKIRYFDAEPNQNVWEKIGTPGSKNWRWITDGNIEKYINASKPIPEGYCLGRLKN